MNLRRKTIENTLIVFIVTLFTRAVNLLTKIILARLLFPKDFGLVAVASIIINAVSLFRELGVESALIYRKDRVKEASDTAFIMMPFIAAFLYLIVYYSAPYAASFWNQSEISGIIRLSGITLLLLSFGSVPLTLLSKKLDFRRAAIPEVVSTITYTLTTTVLALSGFRVWSLVYGGLVSSFAGLVSVWLISPYRPSMRFDVNLAKEMMAYGKYVLGAQIVIFVLGNLDNAVVGKMLDMTSLGYYAMAFSLASFPATNITHIVGKILFPTYSLLEGDKGKLGVMFLKVVKYVSLLTIPVSFGLFVFSREIVEFVLSDKWVPAIPAFRILCFYGLLRSLNATTGDLFKAVGDPKYLRDISLIQLIFVVILILPAVTYGGLVGVALLIVFNGVLATLLAFSRALREVSVSVGFLLDTLKPPLLASGLAFTIIVGLNNLFSASILFFVLKLVLFAGVYASVLYLLDRRLLLEVKEIIFEAKSLVR